MSNFGFFFFSEKKAAYEIRISDWSSDVFSSDLEWFHAAGAPQEFGFRGLHRGAVAAEAARVLRRRRIGQRQAVGAAAVPVRLQIGSASCRARVCQYGSISVMARFLNKKILATGT